MLVHFFCWKQNLSYFSVVILNMIVYEAVFQALNVFGNVNPGFSKLYIRLFLFIKRLDERIRSDTLQRLTVLSIATA